MKKSVTVLALLVIAATTFSCKKKLKGDTLVYEGAWSSIENNSTLIYYGRTQMDIQEDGSVFYSTSSGFDEETIDGRVRIKDGVLTIKFLHKSEKTFSITKEPFTDKIGKVMILDGDTFRVL